MARAKEKHGMRYHPVYKVWMDMVQRCRCPRHHAWKHYGGRGITVCPQWENSFATFWADMGPTYRPGLTLDRARNDLGYTKNNCAWVSQAQQTRNKRNNRRIPTPWGTLTMSEAARRAGISVQTLHGRLRYGLHPRDWFVQRKRGYRKGMVGVPAKLPR